MDLPCSLARVAFDLVLERVEPELVIPVLRELARTAGESDRELNLRLVESGWEPRVIVLEAISPQASMQIRQYARQIAREVKKLGRDRGDSDQPQNEPNWDVLAMSFWRLMDTWVRDSTRASTLLGRIWRKVTLRD